jgi:hypothetical protein
MKNFEELESRILALRAKCAARGDRMFLGIPDFWFEKPGPKFRCMNDHVSGFILKSEERGDLCLECQESVLMTFPDDKDGEFDDVPK